MTREDICIRIKKQLGDKLVNWTDTSPTRIYVEVRPEDIPAVTELVFNKLGARFQIASGVDTPCAIEILYHWAFDKGGFIVTIRTKLDRDAPEIQSLAGICKGTEWIEREMWELLGIVFQGHPDMRHLLLKADWPDGEYPLRRDYIRPDRRAQTADDTEGEG